MDELGEIRAYRSASALNAAMGDCKRWIKRAERTGDWQGEYGQWAELYAAAEAAIYQIPPTIWHEEMINDILQLLSWDIEVGRVQAMLLSNPALLLTLGHFAVDCPDWEARSQIATALGHVKADEAPVVETLITLACDPHQHVARCAMLALAERRSLAAEAFAMRAWASGHTDLRVAGMHALAALGSPHLDAVLEAAELDPHPYVRQAGTHVAQRRPGMVRPGESLPPGMGHD